MNVLKQIYSFLSATDSGRVIYTLLESRPMDLDRPTQLERKYNTDVTVRDDRYDM